MTGGGTATAFFDKTYDETLALLVELRAYIVQGEARDRRALAPLDGMRLSQEAMRMTARLTQIMAWLLAQKAIHAGELGQADAMARHEPLAGIAACMADEPADGSLAILPRHFRALLERSRRLYIRVARLDEMVRRAVA